jgi:hypothetical protein
MAMVVASQNSRFWQIESQPPTKENAVQVQSRRWGKLRILGAGCKNIVQRRMALVALHKFYRQDAQEARNFAVRNR